MPTNTDDHTSHHAEHVASTHAAVLAEVERLTDLLDEASTDRDGWQERYERLREGLERIAAVAEEALERLSEISSLYTEAVCGDITQIEAWNGVERALRGHPPEGEAMVPVLSARLVEARSLLAPGEDK